jgi:hypothetical protein
LPPSTTGVVDTSSKVVPGVNNTRGKLPLVSTSPTTGVNDTGVGTLSNFWHLKVNLKEIIYLYVNSTTQRCPNKIIKTFLIKEFFHLPMVSLTPLVHLELRKFETALMEYSGYWGKLIHEKI